MYREKSRCAGSRIAFYTVYPEWKTNRLTRNGRAQDRVSLYQDRFDDINLINSLREEV